MKDQIIDEITRIYKNSSDRVIGIHCISVKMFGEVNPDPIPGNIKNNRFDFTIGINEEFTRLNLQMGEDRIISKIQMIGKYEDFTYNFAQTDFKSVTYKDRKISLAGFPTIGDEI